MKIWIKLTKHFRNGERTDYMLVRPVDVETEDQKEEIMNDWGESTDGGHNYGYRVEMSALENGQLPPKEWLEHKINGMCAEIEILKLRIDRVSETIIEYQEIVNTMP